jgi:hypothetical protein
MNRTLCLRVLGGVCVVFQLSCDAGQLAAPSTSEQLAVTVQNRTAMPGEVVPTIHVSGGVFSVAFQVSRQAMCGTIVEAGLGRGQHELSVVARVWSGALADCFTIPRSALVDYSGKILVVAPGSYLVRIFDANGNETPRLIGSARATVTAR